MLTATAPGSSWPFCRIAPKWLGTWKARPRYVLLPTFGQDAFSHPAHPASPHQSGGCVLDSHRQELPRVRWDYRRPYPSTSFAATPQWAPATITLKGPPWASTSRLCLVPALPPSVGLRPIKSPQNVLSP